MSLPDYTNANTVVTINGRLMTDFGDTATPYTDEPIDPKNILRRGQGGNAVRLGRKNPGRRVNLYFNPGSADSAYMQALFNTNATITATFTQIGTLEAFAGSEGVIVNDGQNGRAGTTITDDLYIIEFNIWEGTKGGA